MDLDKYFGHEQQQFDENFQSGFVTFLGRPNAGKSTLLNAIMGKKLAITSSTSQTTRHRFRAVYTQSKFQMVIVDTPGLHKPNDALGEELNTSALKALDGVDVVAVLIDTTATIGRGDGWVVSQLTSPMLSKTKKVCVLTKCDIATNDQVQQQKQKANELFDWDDMLCLSAKTGQGVSNFISCIKELLPKGPAWFPKDMETDQPIEVIVAEFIREKILRSFHDEVPHAIGVSVEHMEYNKKNNLNRIFARIYVERESQKGIIIGKRGAAIKKIGTQARADLQQLLGTKVYLDLIVKVKKNWRQDASQIRRFGYGEGA